MTDPIDASMYAGDDSRSGRKPSEGGDPLLTLNARGFSAIMHRETAIRASLRPARPADKGALLGGLYLAPNMRRALAALLRGDPVTVQERAALSHAVSLLPADEPEAAAPRTSREGVWAGLVDAANSNNVVPDPGRGLVVPLLPHRILDNDDNHVLRGLGLKPDTPQDE